MADVWMIVQWVVYSLLALVLLAPLSTLLHTLGHAAAALALTRGFVEIQLGQKGKVISFPMGRRLRVNLYLEPGIVFGIYRLLPRPYLMPQQYLWITLAGPLVSLWLTLFFCSLTFSPAGSLFWVTPLLINLALFLNSAIPFVYPRWQGIQGGLANDGLQIYRLLRRRAS